MEAKSVSSSCHRCKALCFISHEQVTKSLQYVSQDLTRHGTHSSNALSSLFIIFDLFFLSYHSNNTAFSGFCRYCKAIQPVKTYAKTDAGAGCTYEAVSLMQPRPPQRAERLHPFHHPPVGRSQCLMTVMQSKQWGLRSRSMQIRVSCILLSYAGVQEHYSAKYYFSCSYHPYFFPSWRDIMQNSSHGS
jgi:hypothetical protein